MKKIVKVVGRSLWWVFQPVLRVVGKVLGILLWPLSQVLLFWSGMGLWSRMTRVSHALAPYLPLLWGGLVAVGVLWVHILPLWAVVVGEFAFGSAASAAAVHTAYVCVRCAADIPADPGLESALKIHHLKRHHRYGLVISLAYVVSTLSAVVFTPQHWLGGYGFYIIFAGSLATLAAPQARWRRTHARLMPWCPWCRDGGGDDEEFEPVDPDPHGRKEPVS